MGSYLSKATPSPKFRFLDLPPELQDLVYEQYLANLSPEHGNDLTSGLMGTSRSVRERSWQIYKKHVNKSRESLRERYEAIANGINQTNVEHNGSGGEWDMLEAIDRAMHFFANEKEWLHTDARYQREIMRMRRFEGLEGSVFQATIAHVPRGTTEDQLDVVRLAWLYLAEQDAGLMGDHARD
ncbi:hypothetical protein CLAFUW4_13988 [Fulvia fulva]|nr:hypothetical protein CLAFUR4_13991 [Fulvia fulva]KAK4610869.1 hypothetical protein CLAFUR0_13995 [Fulvia fulva]WPV21838.1 hypothetical protein CLAFUW4_13988 [Fulvia fulva]